MKKFFAIFSIFALSCNVAFAKLNALSFCDTKVLQELAVEILKSNLVDCKLQKGEKCFTAGAFWNQLWVRDTSYSSLMGLYKFYPQELKNTFRELVLMNGKNGYPQQDPSSDFGRFPYQTDSIVWVIGAFELAKKTNDQDFRKYVYGVGKKMRNVWLKAVDKRDGLLFGAPSFLDSWASFPEDWKGKPNVFLKNKFLSTNVLWLRFEEIMLWESKNSGEITQENFDKKLQYLQERVGILNEQFYNPEKKYYSYYIGSDRYEALGNGLIKKFHFNSHPIEQVKTDENFYPAHYPMYDFKIAHNWYSETVQHTWIDTFLAGIEKEPLDEFCPKYFSLVTQNNDIAELIQDGKMFGGSKQLWSAMGMYFYLDSIKNRQSLRTS